MDPLELSRHSVNPQVTTTDSRPRLRALVVQVRLAWPPGVSPSAAWPDGQDPASWLADHGQQGLAATTRRGCLEASSNELRPHHCGSIVAAAAIGTMPSSGDRTDAFATVVHEVARVGERLGPNAKRRYEAAVAELLVPAAVEATVEHTAKLHGIKDLIEQLGRHGSNFGVAGRSVFAANGAVALDVRHVAPADWAERRIVAAIDASGKATSRPKPLLVDDIPPETLLAHFGRGRGDEIGVVGQVEQASGGLAPALAETPSRRLTQTTSAVGCAHEGVLDLMSPEGLLGQVWAAEFAAGLDTGRGPLMSTPRY